MCIYAYIFNNPNLSIFVSQDLKMFCLQAPGLLLHCPSYPLLSNQRILGPVSCSTSPRPRFSATLLTAAFCSSLFPCISNVLLPCSCVLLQRAPARSRQRSGGSCYAFPVTSVFSSESLCLSKISRLKNSLGICCYAALSAANALHRNMNNTIQLF